MPRIRTVKPDWAQDEILGRVSLGAQLLFLGLITQADDEGRHRGDPALLRAVLWPYKPELADEQVDRWLAELAEGQLIIRYQSAGRPLVQVRSFAAHQVIRKRQASRLPAPEGEWQTPPTPPGEKSQLELAEQYLTSAAPVTHGREEEWNGDGDPPKAPPTSGGARFRYRIESGEVPLAAAGGHPGKPRGGRRARQRQRGASQPAPSPAAQPCPLEALGDAAAAMRERWTPINEKLKQTVDEDAYGIWLAPLHLHVLTAHELEVGAPPGIARWVERRYERVLRAAAGGVPVRFVACAAAELAA